MDVWALCKDLLRKKYELPEEDHCASRWKERSHLVVYLQRQQDEEALQLVVRGVWRQIRIEWKAPDRILVVQLGTNEEEAKVFRARMRSRKDFVRN